jgi:hypothetical protein
MRLLHLASCARSLSLFVRACVVAAILFGIGFGPVSALPTETPTHAHQHATASEMIEHQAALRLVDDMAATHVAVRNGSFTAPQTWRDRVVPPTGARILIPAGVNVTLASSLLERTYEWIRVDGGLQFAGDRDTGLKVVTLVVGENGRLAIGRQDDRVRANVRAIVEFADRGPRDREADPFDLGGGLIVLGSLQIYGARVTGHLSAVDGLVRGQTTIKVAQPPLGWRPDDLVVIPGVKSDVDEDEVMRIAKVDASGRRITLAAPLRYAHLAPVGAEVRIGNLTRNVIFRSENGRRIDRRGHAMIMHVQTGINIDGAGFYGLGRTDTRVAHTIPVVDDQGALVDGTDSNTIGRYPIHFHIREGARYDLPPNIVRNSVIVDSPKHGLVNHGGHVVAEGNVTFKVDGAHFFAENGSEIGAFKRNLAIRSTGSELAHVDDGLMSRMYVYDFGHGGYGYWLQGGGVKLIGNYAFGHNAAAYSINGNIMREGKRTVFFSPKNVDNSAVWSVSKLHPGSLPFLFAGNQGAASFNGLEIWYSQIHATHSVPSVVENSFFWALARHGVNMPYSRNIVFRDVTVLGSGRDPTSFGFGNTNDWADSLIFERVRAEGFAVGVDMPTKGSNRISDSYLDSLWNIRIRGGPGTDLDVDITDVRFGTSGQLDIVMQGLPVFTREIVEGYEAGAMMPRSGDLSPFFGRVRVIVNDHRSGVSPRQVYFTEQASGARPFADLGISEMTGLTSQEAWDKFGLAVGGTVAPPGTRVLPRTAGLVGPLAVYPPLLHLTSDRFTKNLIGYVPRVKDEQGEIRLMQPVNLQPGWNLVRSSPTAGAQLVFADSTPPVFEQDSGFRPEIHPDDLQFGVMMRGWVVATVGAVKSRTLFAKEFKPLAADPDGFVRFDFTVEDAIGGRAVVPVALRVTDKAVRRGSNSLYYSQGVYSSTVLPERGSATAGTLLR